MGDVERLKELVEAYEVVSGLPTSDKLCEARGGLLEAIILLTESVAKETKEFCEKPEREREPHPYWRSLTPDDERVAKIRPFMTPPEPPAMREGECGRRVGDKPKRRFWFRG